jgi:hypothetical protein
MECEARKNSKSEIWALFESYVIASDQCQEI